MTTTTTAPTSAHNPFRSPAATPNPTGPPGPSSSPPRPGAATPPRSAAASRNTPEATGLDEELPPAYTPGPDVRHGETTVEYGPQRPFQPAPAPAPAPPRSPDPHPQPQYRPPPTSPPSIPTYSAYQNQHQHQHQNQTIPSIRRQLAALTTQLTGLAVHGVSSLSAGTTSRLSPQPTVAVTGSSWAGYPGQQQRLHPHYTSPAAAPPPLPPRRASISTSDPVSPAPLSDFARDFYAHGPADPDSPSSSSPAPPEDSGRPTTSPKPGRALLRDGKLLVYPAGYTCPKSPAPGFSSAAAHLARPLALVPAATTTASRTALALFLFPPVSPTAAAAAATAYTVTPASSPTASTHALALVLLPLLPPPTAAPPTAAARPKRDRVPRGRRAARGPAVLGLWRERAGTGERFVFGLGGGDVCGVCWGWEGVLGLMVRVLSGVVWVLRGVLRVGVEGEVYY
ncbi:hypothetical protein LshimejAT787_1000210 [Lyophyllum shimeji]|uniref:Uncharacterized protein n=1 Tax=Lyophyllum shimeji TaxID=47721 RepID=A0A9P3PTI2_LYOSH|nr:hypothetical protein LshimejAT787_1000210 [Lyophyllum shimeji]